MTKTLSFKYNTAGGVTVARTSMPVAYGRATQSIESSLNSQQGALFCSSYEYPGRYSRWDIGFVNPPLMIYSRGRVLFVQALNERGSVLIDPVRQLLEHCYAVAGISSQPGLIEATLKPAMAILFEEERSRQHTMFSILREVIACFKSPDDEFLGLYGAFGYDLAFQFEAIDLKLKRLPGARDLVLYLPDEVLVVDHQNETATRYSYEFAVNQASTSGFPRSGRREEFRYTTATAETCPCDHSAGEYTGTVRKAREYFARGDLFETVPGQMFREPCRDLPSNIFRRLKEHNPSPYGAFINLGEQEYLVAASPEMYVRVEGNRVETCPISGTIARGRDAMEDADQIKRLLNSGKDEAELSMCTDVDRNDKSRICMPGSVRIIGRRQTELYSRLIHTVDHVDGILKPEFDALDAFLTHTWAVTVTGAPKRAAIQFIEDHEMSPRRWYGGALGFLKFNGDINTGLTLRTIRIDQGMAEVRAGATLLYDSDPEAEEAETRLKASALLAAIRNDYPETTAYAGYDSGRNTGTRLQILMVDHQDSFVHTLSAYFQETGAIVKTVRPQHCEQTLSQFQPDLVVLSPGPGRPADFQLPATIALCLQYAIPVFGVCLGLQGIIEYFGGTLETLAYPMHGKSSEIKCSTGCLFHGLPETFTAGRYHSLIAGTVPDCLQVTARTEDNVVMAVEHRTLPVYGVQFHPESLLTLRDDAGRKIIQNLVRIVTSNRYSESMN